MKVTKLSQKEREKLFLEAVDQTNKGMKDRQAVLNDFLDPNNKKYFDDKKKEYLSEEVASKAMESLINKKDTEAIWKLTQIQPKLNEQAASKLLQYQLENMNNPPRGVPMYEHMSQMTSIQKFAKNSLLNKIDQGKTDEVHKAVENNVIKGSNLTKMIEGLETPEALTTVKQLENITKSLGMDVKVEVSNAQNIEGVGKGTEIKVKSGKIENSITTLELTEPKKNIQPQKSQSQETVTKLPEQIKPQQSNKPKEQSNFYDRLAQTEGFTNERKAEMNALKDRVNKSVERYNAYKASQPTMEEKIQQFHEDSKKFMEDLRTETKATFEKIENDRKNAKPHWIEEVMDKAQSLKSQGLKEVDDKKPQNKTNDKQALKESMKTLNDKMKIDDSQQNSKSTSMSTAKLKENKEKNDIIKK
ncbi:MAG: hypothetical protein J0H68_08740 [Sphingobacteriia bacterium]|nr:hypothetical protein [Sphingobacteriia bacterium]